MLSIYVVDDAADYRFIVQQVFNLFLPQYSLRLFTDGLELIQYIDGLKKAPEIESPKLILLDVDMPKLSGPQTLEQLNQYPVWSSIPVVMMSNRFDSEFVNACYQLGACSYIIKPTELDSLKKVMELLCKYWLELNQLPSFR